MKSRSLALIALSTFTLNFAAQASEARTVVGSNSNYFAPSLKPQAASLIEGAKLKAVTDAKQQCASAVKQISPFQIETGGGQYGAYFEVSVRANFECIYGTSDQALQASFASSHVGLVKHIVVFRYKKTTTLAQQTEVAQKFLALRDQCKQNGKAYVVSLDSGTHNSREQADQNMDQGFIVTFKSIADRDYYVGQPHAGAAYPAQFDTAHDAFKKWLGQSGYLDDAAPNPVFVFDFTAQSFQVR